MRHLTVFCFTSLLCLLHGAPAASFRLEMIYNHGTTINEGITPDNLCDLNGTLFFSGSDGTSVGDHGNELWTSNGTSVGTLMVADISPGTSSSTPNDLVALNGKLIFSAAVGTDRELYLHDPTLGTASVLLDIRPGSSGGNPATMTSIGNSVYFRATDGTHGQELWKTDGTAAGTLMVKDAIAGATGTDPTHFYGYGSHVYFQGGGSQNSEMWRTDGTTAGTTLFKDINPTGNSGASYFQELNGQLLFAASNGSQGLELYKSDGTTAGTTLLKDIVTGSATSNPFYFKQFGDHVYFSADDGVNGREIWRTDGTAAGTQLFMDIVPGSGSSTHNNFTVVGDYMFFNANDGTHGAELWVTDGTVLGTYMVQDIRVGSGSGFGASGGATAEVNGVLYFPGNDGTHGGELWAAYPVSDTRSYHSRSSYSYRTRMAHDAGLLSEMKLLDGVTGGERDLAMTFSARTGTDLSLLASDRFEFTGASGDTFVLELSYDAATALGLFASEDGVRLLWWNGTAWINAVEGNSGGTPFFVSGAYDGVLTLGHYGLDEATNTVWAVLNHNSSFAAGESVPEPSAAALLLPGLLTLCHRRRRSA